MRSSSSPHLRRLALQHLRHQVAGHRALAAGELPHEALRVGMPGERDRRQPQAGGPSLGALVQQRQPPRRRARPRTPPAAPAPRRARSAGRASRSSVSSPASRSRCSPSRGLLARGQHDAQPRRAGGRGSARATLSASAERSSCRSSITSTTGSSSDRGPTAAARPPPRRWKAGDGLDALHEPAPPTAPASASTTDSQNRCASRSPRSTDTHADAVRGPTASAHERSSTVLPLPAGAQTTTTPPGRGVRQEMEQRVAPDQPAFAGSMRPARRRARVAVYPSGITCSVLPAGASRKERR